jgi:phage terminase small subunit
VGSGTPAKGSAAPGAGRVARGELVDGDGLSLREKAFCVAYLSNGFNGALAYRTVSPGCTVDSAKAEGSIYLAKPCIRAYVSRQTTKAFEAAGMSGAEALGRLAQDAKADIRELFDEFGNPLPPQRWPETIASSVEAYERTKDGFRVRLVSKLAARRTILELTGKLKSPLSEELSVLARALRGDLERLEPGA